MMGEKRECECVDSHVSQRYESYARDCIMQSIYQLFHCLSPLVSYGFGGFSRLDNQ